MNRKIIAALLALVVIAGGLTAVFALKASSTGVASFSDVNSGDWYYDQIMSLSGLCIVNGMPDGSFQPDGELTHGQFLKMLAYSFYYYAVPEVKDGKMRFASEEIVYTHWADPYRYAAVAVGVLASDEGEGAEFLDSPINRYEVALLMVRASELVLGEKKADVERSAALVKDSVPQQYLYSVAQAYGKGYIGGYEDGSFRGENTLTRAEAATVLYRLIFPEKRISTGVPEYTAPTSPTSGSTHGSAHVTVDADWFSDAVFLGDSLTDGLRSYSGLETADFLCSSGATVESLMERTPSYLGGRTVYQALSEGSYGKVFIMLGINQIVEDSEKFLSLYEKFIDEVLKLQPDAEIYVQSVLPVTRAKDAGGEFTIANVTRLNGVLRKMCADRGYAYMDVYSALADADGFMPDNLSWDGIHLQAETYVLWLEKLTGILQAMY